MSNIKDWILSLMRLGDMEDEQVELEHVSRICYKNIQNYEDCRLIIDNYKAEAICIYSLDPAMNSDAQGMMNYICGGIYALGGNVINVGENIFMVVEQ